jgi:hypothetical protein
LCTLSAKLRQEEIGRAHHRKQFVVVRQIDRRFGRELERIAPAPLPLRQRRQEPLQRLLVADHVIVDERDVAAVAGEIERVQLLQHLLIGLGARNAAVELDDVAELAIERAAARELHANMEINAWR